MALEGVVNKIGPLAETSAELDILTAQHASEITNDRRTQRKRAEKKELRDTPFWTADSILYRVEDSEAILYFGDRSTNLIFRNIEEAIAQLIRCNNYTPGQGDIQSVISSAKTGNTLRIRLSDLELQEDNEECSFFEISTTHYDKLNDTQRAFAEKVYGQGDFVANMRMLKNAGKSIIRIYVLNPDYVKSHVAEDCAIARLSKLENFGELSEFYATERDVNEFDVALRGVPLISQEEKQTISYVLELLTDPAAQRAAADILTPYTSQGLLTTLKLHSDRT